MYVIVDTNLLRVANKEFEGASPQCILNCVIKLQEIKQQFILVLDNRWLIIEEYKKNAREKGQPGVGDAFLKWVLTNQFNPKHCQLVKITPRGENDFEEFPQDPALAKFDLSDRKFVAVTLAHPDSPPILNAVDSDWKEHQTALAAHGIKIEFLCPDILAP